MSWDVFIMKFPGGVTTLKDLPEGWSPPSLGPRAEVMRRLLAGIPGATRRDSSTIDIKGDGFAADLMLHPQRPADRPKPNPFLEGGGKSEPDPTPRDHDEIDCVSMSAYGGHGAVSAAAAIMRLLGARAVATGLSEPPIVGPDGLEEAYGGWRKYRDQVIEKFSHD